MNLFTQNRWRWYARFVLAWVLVLFGLLLSIPAIHLVVDAIVPWSLHWTWPELFRWLRYPEMVYGMFYVGMPAILTWTLAWCVRSGSAPHPAWLYITGVISILALIPFSQIWVLGFTYFLVGGVFHLWRKDYGAQPLPRTPSQLIEQLVRIAPEFKQFWQRHQNAPLGEERSFTYCEVFSQFSRYYQEAPAPAASMDMKRLGQLVSLCIELGIPELANAAKACFLEQRAIERAIRKLRPYLSRRARRIAAEPPGVHRNFWFTRV